MADKLFRQCACGRAFPADDERERCDVCEAERADWRYLRRYEHLRSLAASQRRTQTKRQVAIDAAFIARRDAQLESDVQAMLEAAGENEVLLTSEAETG